jgi:hypothetical protein
VRWLADKQGTVRLTGMVSVREVETRQREKDWLAERGEFEQPVPICEQSDDSIGLAFRHRDELQNEERGHLRKAAE